MLRLARRPKNISPPSEIWSLRKSENGTASLSRPPVDSAHSSPCEAIAFITETMESTDERSQVLADADATILRTSRVACSERVELLVDELSRASQGGDELHICIGAAGAGNRRLALFVRFKWSVA